MLAKRMIANHRMDQKYNILLGLLFQKNPPPSVFIFKNKFIIVVVVKDRYVYGLKYFFIVFPDLEGKKTKFIVVVRDQCLWSQISSFRSQIQKKKTQIGCGG